MKRNMNKYENNAEVAGEIKGSFSSFGMEAKGNVVGEIKIAFPALVVEISGSSEGSTQESIFPMQMASGEIVDTSISSTAAVILEPKEREKLIQTVDIAKTYTNELEISLTLKKGFTFKIKRSPKNKVIRSYKEKG